MQLANLSPARTSAEAWHRTVELHTPRLWRVTRAAGVSPGAAAEICQLAFLRLRQLGGRAPDDPGPWLDALVRREAAAELRHTASAHRLAAAQPA